LRFTKWGVECPFFCKNSSEFRVIHDDISLIRFVIPGSTEPAPYLIRGNIVFLKPKLSDFSFIIVENHNVGVRFIEPER
jgi:hypothetical protein